MGGILGTGLSYQQGALSGMQRTASLEQAREAYNKQADAAETNQKISTTMSGAAVGAMIGSETYPVIGTIVGAAIGYLASEVF